MARIVYGSIITDIKGSIGGITYQKNGSGTIARLKPRKNQTNTQKQRDQQPRLKEVQRNWNVLSLTNKVLWNDFASVNNKIGLDGTEKVLTGYQWFLTINQNRLLFGDTILLVPPVYEIVNPVDSVEFEYGLVSLLMPFNVTIPAATWHFSFYVSFVLNSVSKFDFNKCRLVRKVNLGSSANVTVASTGGNTFWNEYYKSDFPPNLGNKDFYLVGYVRFVSPISGISSMAYTAISKFIWDGVKYVIE